LKVQPAIVDFETYYADDYSLSNLTVEAYVRDPRFQIIGVSVVTKGSKVWVPGPERSVEYLRSLDWSDKLLAAHNNQFDGFIAANVVGIQPAMYGDTLSMARPLHGANVGGSLKKLAAHYGIGEKGTEVVDAKGKRHEDFTPEELTAYGRYCVNDAVLCGKLLKIFLPHFTWTETRVIDLTLRMAIEPVFNVDVPLLEAALKTLQDRTHAELLQLGGIMDPLFDGDVEKVRKMLASAPKFAEFLRSRGVNPPTKPSPTNPEKTTFAFAKTDQPLLDLLESEDPLVVTAVEQRMQVKSTVRETRMKSFIDVGRRGTLPFPLRYSGAHTNRWSGDWGWNLQNLPKHRDVKAGDREPLRDALLAPEGYMVIAADSSQIEARVNAWFWGQENVVRQFAAGEDLYCDFATIAYGRPITKADIIERFVGKGCRLGLGFGMGPPKLQLTLRKPVGGISVDLPIDEAERLVHIYRTTDDKIVGGWKTCQRAIEAMHVGADMEFGVGAKIQVGESCLTLPSGNVLRYPNLRFTVEADESRGRPRRVASYHDREKKKWKYLYGAKLVENIVQAMARDIIAWQAVQLADLGWQVRGNVHDELIFLVPEAEADRCLADVERVMKTAPAWAEGCPVSCESGMARNYGEC
jgi:hypothetical protein